MVNCLQFFSADSNLGGDWLGTVCHSLVFSALISMPHLEVASSSCFTRLASSSFFSVRPSMSSANLRLVIVRPPMLTVSG